MSSLNSGIEARPSWTSNLRELRAILRIPPYCSTRAVTNLGLAIVSVADVKLRRLVSPVTLSRYRNGKTTAFLQSSVSCAVIGRLTRRTGHLSVLRAAILECGVRPSLSRISLRSTGVSSSACRPSLRSPINCKTSSNVFNKLQLDLTKPRASYFLLCVSDPPVSLQNRVTHVRAQR